MSNAIVHLLETPPDASEKGGHEVLRCFVVDGGLSVAMRRSFDDAGMWGVLLADLARHAARIYARETDVSEDDALDLMKAAFESEFMHPADPGFSTTRN